MSGPLDSVGGVAVWQCGSVAVWQCGSVACAAAPHLLQERLCSFYLHKDPRRDLEDVFKEFQESNLAPSHGRKGPLLKDHAVSEIFHVRMRLLDETVPVQPLVQKEEVLQRPSLSPASPHHGDVHLEMHTMPEDYMVSSQSSSSSNSRQLKPRAQLGGEAIVWANFCRLGREMAHPAIAKLTQRQVHAGPAKFEFGDDEFVDWVDGQAMLYRLKIGEDGCQYQNRWLDTWNHRMHKEAGRIAVRETCSRPSLPNFWERFMYLFSPPNNENGNLHISQIAGSRCISMSVGSACLEFDLETMDTFGKVPFDDELVEGGPLIFHAEPHVDKTTGAWALIRAMAQAGHEWTLMCPSLPRCVLQAAWYFNLEAGPQTPEDIVKFKPQI
eukprot:s100_g25.t1